MAKILVCDDEKRYRTHLERAISNQGHEVRVAESAEVALEVARDFPPDLLVVDWMLRGELDGLQLAEELGVRSPTWSLW